MFSDLKDVAEIISGFAFKSSSFSDKEDGTPIIKISNINDSAEVSLLSKNQEYYPFKVDEKMERFVIRKGDILIALSGATTGKTGVYEQERKALLNQRIALIRALDNDSNKYLFYFLQTKSQQVLKDSYGGAQPNISPKKLEAYPIYYPDSRERNLITQAIETQFTRLDAAIKSLKAIKNKIVVYRETILKEAFTTGFSTSVTFRNLRLDDLKGEGRHAIKRGPFGSAIKKSFFVPKGYKVYEQKNAIYNDFRLGDYYINEDKFKELAAFEIKPGDLIISCSGTIGKVAVAPDNIEKGIINQALLKITLNHKVILTKYFIYLFQSRYLQHEVNKKTRGSAMLNISSVKDLKQIDFPVAKLDEQRKIAEEIESRFSVVDKLEEVVDNSLNKAEKLRKSILKAAFEGKLVN